MNSDNYIFCKCCGYKFPSGTKFCRYCGTMLESSYSPDYDYSDIDSPSKENSNNNSEAHDPPYFQTQPMISYPMPMSSTPSPSRHGRKGILSSIGSGIADITSKAFNRNKTKQNDLTNASTKNNSSISFTMMSPNEFIPEQYTSIKLFMFEEAYRYIVDNSRTAFGNTAEDTMEIFSEIPEGSLITAELHTEDGVSFNHKKIDLVWNGKYIIFPFAAKIPADYSDNNICIDATISVNHFPYIKMQIIPLIKSNKKQKNDILYRFVENAFISYSHLDINEVLIVYDTMRKMCPKTNFFFDKIDIPTGREWNQVIMSKIDSSEIFYLCWSSNAKASEYVTKEWSYAIKKHGIHIIDPIPLEVVDNCIPPDALSELEFNTNTMFIKNYYKSYHK